MERILTKLTSGRFIVTLAAAYVFIKGAFTVIPEAQVTTIISMVITFYFLRPDRPPESRL